MTRRRDERGGFRWPSVALRWLLPIGCVWPLVAAHAAKPDTRFQRMLLVPGCRVLAAGASAAATAYCLDEEAPGAPRGTAFSHVSHGLGGAVVRFDDGRLLPLQAAIDQHLIAVESRGADDYFHATLRNLTGRRVQICVTSPTLLTGGTDFASRDITDALRAAARVAAAARDTADPAIESREQRLIWDSEAAAADDDNHLAPALAAPLPAAGAGQAGTNCTGGTGVVLCSGR